MPSCDAVGCQGIGVFRVPGSRSSLLLLGTQARHPLLPIICRVLGWPSPGSVSPLPHKHPRSGYQAISRPHPPPFTYEANEFESVLAVWLQAEWEFPRLNACFVKYSNGHNMYFLPRQSYNCKTDTRHM